MSARWRGLVALAALPALAACDPTDPLPPREAPSIALSTRTLYFSLEPGSPADSTSASVSSSGPGVLEWTAAADQGWVRVSPAAGTVPARGSTPLTVTVDPAGLAWGTHTAIVTVTAAGASNTPRTLDVELTVVPGPFLRVSPGSLRFEAQPERNPASAQLRIANEGGGQMSWSASASVPWLLLQDGGGVLNAGKSTLLTVGVTTAGLAPGRYEGNVTLSAPGAVDGEQTIAAVLVVNPAP